MERLGVPKGATATGALAIFSNFFGLNCRLVKKFDFIQGRNFLVESAGKAVEEEIRRRFVIGAGLFCFAF